MPADFLGRGHFAVTDFWPTAPGASAVAPPIIGLFGDRFGLPATMAGIAIGVLATIPLAVILNPLLLRAWAP